MGFFKKIFKGIKKVVKGIGKVVKKVVKSKAFKVIAAVALAVVAPQLIPTVMKGITAAGSWAANTIATGAKMAWSATKAIGKGLKTFGSKIFSSVTDTISKGVEFMKGKLGFKPTFTPVNPATDAVGSNFISAVQGKSFAAPAKKTVEGTFKKVGKKLLDPFTKILDPITDIAKDPVKELVVDPITGIAKDVAGEKILDTIAGERREKSLLGSPVYTAKTGDFDSSGGFAPLMSLSIDTQSPYISYNQGQQLFGMEGQA